MQGLDETERNAGAVIVGGFDGTSLPAEIARRLEDGRLAGVTLFKRNVTGVTGAWRLCREILAARPDAIVSIDQEGGRVARLGAPVPKLPPMRALGTLDDVAFTRNVFARLGRCLAAIGINLDFAPVTDVDTRPDNPIIGDRSFARDPETVGRHAVAVVEGLTAAGVLSCAKHFPGHGDTDLDSHLALPTLPHARARLDAVELAPFRATIAAGVPTLMTAHVVFEAMAPGVPATLSRDVITGLLRDQLGFDGVCFSDDLHMKAVADHWGLERAGVLAIEAGCDGLLVCTDPDSQEQVRAALVSRARTDAVFERRLAGAAARMARLRTERWRARPVEREDALDAVFRDPTIAGLEQEIAARLGT